MWRGCLTKAGWGEEVGEGEHVSAPGLESGRFLTTAKYWRAAIHCDAHVAILRLCRPKSWGGRNHRVLFEQAVCVWLNCVCFFPSLWPDIDRSECWKRGLVGRMEKYCILHGGYSRGEVDVMEKNGTGLLSNCVYSVLLYGRWSVGGEVVWWVVGRRLWVGGWCCDIAMISVSRLDWWHNAAWEWKGNVT